MSDDRLEELLKGYRLPDASPELDHRVLREGTAILESARAGATIVDVGRSVLQHLGFGYLTFFIDWITTTDAEYRVELI